MLSEKYKKMCEELKKPENKEARRCMEIFLGLACGKKKGGDASGNS